MSNDQKKNNYSVNYNLSKGNESSTVETIQPILYFLNLMFNINNNIFYKGFLIYSRISHLQNIKLKIKI